MKRSPPSVLVISPSDAGGGAEMVASGLFDACRQRGLNMRMAVGEKLSADPDVIEIPNDRYRSAWARIWLRAATTLGWSKLRNIGEPLRWLHRFCGREDMDFPGSDHLLDMIDTHVNLIHCHNLHGTGSGFFDLRALPGLSQRVPVILTLHDAWLLAGHCAHSFGCDRWLTGCGECPDLSIPEMIRRDGSAANFRLKKKIFATCSLHVATPSRWLMDRAERSLLAPAVRSARVIPNGIDLGCFRAGGKTAARRKLGLDEDASIILCVGNTLKKNIWRDFDTAAAAAKLATKNSKKTTVLLGLGDSGDRIVDGNLEIRFQSHRGDSLEVATYYRAADLLLHSTRTDTFPSVVLEAMACGLPVVATAVGGIPEQIIDGDTGILVRPGDKAAMAHGIVTILQDPGVRQRFGEAAARRATHHFDHTTMVDRYVDWYQETVNDAESRG